MTPGHSKWSASGFVDTLIRPGFGSPVRPTLRTYDPTAFRGRGLRLVAALCTDWGVELADDGKTGWAELQG